MIFISLTSVCIYLSVFVCRVLVCLYSFVCNCISVFVCVCLSVCHFSSVCVCLSCHLFSSRVHTTQPLCWSVTLSVCPSVGHACGILGDLLWKLVFNSWIIPENHSHSAFVCVLGKNFRWIGHCWWIFTNTAYLVTQLPLLSSLSGFVANDRFFYARFVVPSCRIPQKKVRGNIL